ncbi:uncharacterized protein LOC133316815 [Gastrolobium bilobum]|uniref:uncharacterized protein LOC133316815 n=1 Tax=Gastrolobium bilobum TaxID=150636 RepID=UPI002AB058B6|nr:uncharacterized protein LOC133316815 [Gastrolobium bilobum]
MKALSGKVVYMKRRDHCSINPVNIKSVEENTSEGTHSEHPAQCHGEGVSTGEVEKSQEVDGFGTWMTIQKRNNKRPATPNKAKEHSLGKGKAGSEQNGQGQKSKVSGSRFESLGDEEEKETLQPRRSGNVSAEASQLKRIPENRKNKATADRTNPKQVHVVTEKTPKKQMIQPSMSLDSAMVHAQRSSGREAILNKIQVLALLGTRISGKRADNITRRLGFDSCFRREAVGFSGGIWLLWNKSATCVSILEDNHQFVHTKLSWPGVGQEEHFTFIYGSSRRMERKELWDSLRRISNGGVNRWAVMGDFNVLLEEGEKQGGSGLCWESTDEFASCLSDCNLFDLGFAGPKYTWKRGCLQERIDRLVVNEAWHLGFPNRSITHLLFNGSDHRPIIHKDTSSVDQNKDLKPFRFLAAWLTNDSFGDVVKGCWQHNSEWIPAKSKFHQDATTWHHNSFRGRQNKKYQIQRRLRGIELHLSRGPDEALERLHKDLCNWLAFGDRNSRFFHSATIARTRRNKVTTLRNDEGVWVEEPEELKLLAMNYFKNLYVEEVHNLPKLCIGGLFPPLDYNTWRNFEAAPTSAEIRSTIFGMHPFKAPGVDGLHAVFFQSQWDIMGNSVCNTIKDIFKDPKRVAGINQTLICLIPKVENPEAISQF